MNLFNGLVVFYDSVEVVAGVAETLLRQLRRSISAIVNRRSKCAYLFFTHIPKLIMYKLKIELRKSVKCVLGPQLQSHYAYYMVTLIDKDTNINNILEQKTLKNK